MATVVRQVQVGFTGTDMQLVVDATNNFFFTYKGDLTGIGVRCAITAKEGDPTALIEWDSSANTGDVSVIVVPGATSTVTFHLSPAGSMALAGFKRAVHAVELTPAKTPLFRGNVTILPDRIP